mgnify:CR=1 FL=1
MYLLQKMDKEIEREAAYIGPHRDDIIFKLEENDIKRFGSQEPLIQFIILPLLI